VKLKDEAVVDCPFFAGFVNYLGFDVMKCVNYDRTNPVWTFSVPSCDLEIMRQEFDGDQSILVKSYSNAFKNVQRYASLARQHGGEFLTREYKQFLGI
jgi:hypothetical protein